MYPRIWNFTKYLLFEWRAKLSFEIGRSLRKYLYSIFDSIWVDHRHNGVDNYQTGASYVRDSIYVWIRFFKFADKKYLDFEITSKWQVATNF